MENKYDGEKCECVAVIDDKDKIIADLQLKNKELVEAISLLDNLPAIQALMFDEEIKDCHEIIDRVKRSVKSEEESH